MITSDSYEMQSAFASVIGYLKTPRQIKKWLTSLTMNKPLIDYYRKDLIEILMLSAVCVKHPLILNNFARYTLPMLSLPGFLGHHLRSRYGIDFLYKEENRNKKNKVILQSTGIKKSGNEEVHLELPIQYIVDPAAHKMLKKVLNPAKLSWLSLFIDGYVDDNKVKIYHEYLEGDVNEAIKWMIEHSEEADIIAADLRDTILKQQILPKKIANLDVLNKLWQKTISPGDIGNPYKALFFPIYKHPTKDMLENASLSLLESYLHDVLGVFGIKNSAPQKYDLSQFSRDEFEHGSWRSQKRAISEIIYNKIRIIDFTQLTIKELLKAWTSRVESDFSDNFDSVIQNENHLIDIFYRYIQWAKAAGLSSDKRKSLTQYVKQYLDSQEVECSKKLKLANIIFRECATLDALTEENNAMINLFNKDVELINSLEKIAKEANPSDMPCYRHFKACINNT